MKYIVSSKYTKLVFCYNTSSLWTKYSVLNWQLVFNKAKTTIKLNIYCSTVLRPIHTLWNLIISFGTDNTVQQPKSNSENLSNKILYGDSEVDAYAKFRHTG